MNSNKSIVLAIVGVGILGLLAYGAWNFSTKTSSVVKDESSGVVCTLDAKECPDGSWVGRSGPNCQFVCPIPVSTSTPKGAVTIEAKLNVRVIPITEPITVLSVVEDSRCPIDVQCIQAGTVRVQIKIESGMGIATETIALGGTITTETEAITFVAVRPERESKKTISESDYRFIFRVSKR